VSVEDQARRQCGFDFSSGEVVVEDLDSSCGTYVNGALVRRAALRAGDEVSMAELVIQVQVEGG
jgi:pSer/pThr/pTyr-binding forkhead associated (FHA) protein